jgi:hypothetical protein
METRRAILILGSGPLADTSLAEVRGYGEVFVLARAVPEGSPRYVVDDDLAQRSAQRRLEQAAGRLRDGGARVAGFVGDPHPVAARRDALALFPQADIVLEAA